VSALGVIAPLPRDPPVTTFDGYLASAGVNFRLTRGRILGETRPATRYRQFCARQASRFSAMLGAGVEAKRPELVSVLRAMLLGQQHELSDEQVDLFRHSGTMHVFSISGLHIAVIAGGLHALLLLMRLPRVARFAIELGALWLYVDITGTAPSAVRAFAMVALVEASLLFRVPRNPLAALTASALLVLIFAPLQIFSASFQMSYGIVAALLLLGLPLAERWQAALPLFRHLPKATWGWWRHACDGVWRGTLAATAIGVAAALVGTVAGVRFFELLTPGALIENLWLIPASTAAILMGFIALLCGLAGFTGGLVLANHAAVLLLWVIESGVRASVALPGMWLTASFRAEWLGAVTLTLLLGLLGWGYARQWQGWHRGYWMPFAVVLLALTLGVRLG
jgi:competence protein ComEC